MHSQTGMTNYNYNWAISTLGIAEPFEHHTVNDILNADISNYERKE